MTTRADMAKGATARGELPSVRPGSVRPDTVLSPTVVSGTSLQEVVASANNAIAFMARKVDSEHARIGRHFNRNGVYNDGTLATKLEVAKDLPLNPRNVMWIYDDFMDVAGLHGFSAQASGTGAAVAQFTGESEHPGVLSCATGSTTTGRAGVATNMSRLALYLGSGEVSFYAAIKTPSALSDGTDRYRISSGLLNDLTANPTEGVHFWYSDNLGSGAWVCRTVAGGAATTTTTSLTVAVDTWYSLEIHVNALATEATFFIDGDDVARHTADIPTGTGQEVGMSALNIRKTLGTTSRTAYVDHGGLRVDFSTPR